MLNNVKKNIHTSFPFLKQESGLGFSQEVFDAILTMNISQTLNFSILLIFMETINLISYVITDINGRGFSPVGIGIVLFLLFMAGNLFCCDHLLQMDRTPDTRQLLKHHSYVFTAGFSFFCLSTNYFCLKSRMSAESILMFYIYIAAGPIYTFGESLTAILTTALLSIPPFVIRGAPAAVYCNLFLYSFTSLFLSQVRCRIIGNNLKLLREARDEQIHLQSMAENDPLTHILNRNGFSQRLDTLITSAAQHRAPVAVIMVDIDYFKQYNDMYGHIAGDECLKKVAHTLESHVHQDKDLICRFGGEEFQLFLYGIKPGDAIHAADRLRQSVVDLKLPAANNSVCAYVTISVGVSTAVPSGADTYANMVKAADDALYYAKSHGKNRISFREPVRPEYPAQPSGNSAGSSPHPSETAPTTRRMTMSWELTRF